MIKEKELFGKNVAIMEQSLGKIKYQIECDTPDGIMNCYDLFPGIDLAYTSFHASSCFMREKALPNILEISYCKSGRFECEYKNGDFTYLGEGDCSINIINTHQGCPSFPLGYYDGFAIIVDMDITGDCFSNVVKDVSINLKELVQKFCMERYGSVIKVSPALENVFNELYGAHTSESLGYFRLKVLEVFFLLSKFRPQENIETSAYFSGDQIKKVKAVRADLIDKLDTKISLKSLADKYGLSHTKMKDCFKAVYGKPVYSYHREYKMQVATKMLITTNLSISEIAGRLGYENPSKFSTAFKSITKLSPREYRNKNK